MVSDYVAKILKDAKTKQVSDIHICSGNPVLYRIGKELIPATKERLNPKGR
jgi:Tfp pilus assembly pilus retraction ATPase PilT